MTLFRWLADLGASGFRARGTWLVGLLLAGMRLAAQDITVTEPVWAGDGPVPEQMPKQKGKLRPELPAELENASEPTYVIVRRQVDKTGASIVMSAHGTARPLQLAVEKELSGWKPGAATDHGLPVASQIWMSVICNPKSAGTKLADATPRLLAIAPVIVKERPAPRGEEPVVRMKLSLDAAGAITAAEPVGTPPPAVLEAIRASLAQWKFAPARRQGGAVAAELELSVYCEPPLRKAPENAVPPKLIKPVPPEYPVAMRTYGLRGVVRLGYEVDEKGAVRRPTIISSDNPVFDEPAMEALLQWKYQPATKEGKPVRTRVQQDVKFEMSGRYEGGDSFVQITQRADQAKLPPELRFDVAPQVRSVQIPVYPLEARKERASGKARVAMLIDQRGRVVQVRVVAADRPEFGLALTAAVEGFRFEPAYREGKPVQNLMTFDQQFDRRWLPDDKGDDLIALEKKHPERITAADKMDQPLKPVWRREPVYPVTVTANTGSATVEFYVDENGHARLPRIVDATEPAFGYAAVQAIAAWWFEPPTSGGKPVVVRVRAPFNFKR